MFEPNRLLDIVKHFILFSRNTPEDIKILAGYHQYFAVKKAVESTLRAAGYNNSTGYGALNSPPNGKVGVFWHTQGSGKSLSMLFYTGLLQEVMDSPTFIVLSDRNNLDDQLFEQFAACNEFPPQTAETPRVSVSYRLLAFSQRPSVSVFYC